MSHHQQLGNTPLKFNSEFTPENWWERKTIRLPIGAETNDHFSGAFGSSLLIFGFGYQHQHHNIVVEPATFGQVMMLHFFSSPATWSFIGEQTWGQTSMPWLEGSDLELGISIRHIYSVYIYIYRDICTMYLLTSINIYIYNIICNMYIYIYNISWAWEETVSIT